MQKDLYKFFNILIFLWIKSLKKKKNCIYTTKHFIF